MTLLIKRLCEVSKFQKALALAAGASNPHEAKAAELAARRLMQTLNIDPVTVNNKSLYDYTTFDDNVLLRKLREEWRAAHPDYYYSKADKSGFVRRLRGKPKPRTAKPVNTKMYDGLFETFLDVSEDIPAQTLATIKQTTQQS